MSCQFAGKTYSEGAIICSNGRELRCSGSVWGETGYSCSKETDVNNTEAGSLGNDANAQERQDGRA